MYRIVKEGGTVLVYVWAYEQEHRKFANKDVFCPGILRTHIRKRRKVARKQKLKIPASSRQLFRTKTRGYSLSHVLSCIQGRRA